VGLKFNPPPGWPLPWDFEPPPGWEPDPAWPEPPRGWPMWIGSGAPKVLYQVPAEAAYVPGYMREALEPEPSGGGRRQAKWRSAVRRLARRRGRARGGHRRPRRARRGQVGLAVLVLAALGFTTFALLGRGIKDPSGASTASTGHHSRPVNLLALQAGACFQDPAHGHPIARWAADVTALPCTLAHNAQIFARFQPRSLTYPGHTALLRRGSQHCRSALAARLDGARLSPGASVIDVVPSRARWLAGLRTISCVVVDPAARWTKSLLRANGGRELGHENSRGSQHGLARGHHSAARRRDRRL
jgi:hypothetical protein